MITVFTFQVKEENGTNLVKEITVQFKTKEGMTAEEEEEFELHIGNILSRKYDLLAKTYPHSVITVGRATE